MQSQLGFDKEPVWHGSGEGDSLEGDVLYELLIRYKIRGFRQALGPEASAEGCAGALVTHMALVAREEVGAESPWRPFRCGS